MLDILFFSLFVIVGVMASRIDWKTRQIPNQYPLLVLCIGGLRIVAGLTTIQSALIGAIPCAAIILIMWAIWRKVGWGDIRYAIACGFCLGGMNAAVGAVLSYALFLFAVVYLRCRKKLTPGEGVAFGPFLTAGFGSIFLLNLLGV